MGSAELLTDKLKPVGEAIKRLEAKASGDGLSLPDTDAVSALRGLYEVVCELASQRWKP